MNYITEIGHISLIAALGMALICAVLPLIGWRIKDQRLMLSADPMARLQFILVAIAFAALMLAFARSDFSLNVVWQNSHSQMPFLYKLTGTWGNHEGSMLLWALIVVLFGSGVSYGRNLPLDLRALVISVQSWVSAAFLGFIIFTSNPFARNTIGQLEGRDLNPVLQDMGLAIHPPLLYIGYVGFSITFSFAVAALMLGRVDRAWARWVRPWALIAWMFLTLGIAMGSFWAYYELGWGGYWFWDPVENASLMPWIVGTALLHSAIVVEKRESLQSWTVLLAILTFSLSLLGTFLVRSGVLTSVHTFASDPTRGLFILLILVLFILGSLSLYAMRANSLGSKTLFMPISREGALILNNLFLTVICGTILVGTLYPLVYETLTEEKISVGAPFFNKTATPFIAILALIMPFGPFLTWKRADLKAVTQRLAFVFGISAGFAILIWVMSQPEVSLAPLALIIGFFLCLGALWEPLWRAKAGHVSSAETRRRLRNLPLAIWGGAIAHAGLGLTIIGVVALTAYQTHKTADFIPRQSIALSGYEVSFLTIDPIQGPNFLADRATFSYAKKGQELGTLSTEKRIYPARQQPTTEAGIVTRGLSQLYVSLRENRPDGSITADIYWKPYVLLIWLGAIVMFIGGLLSLLDRRGRRRAKIRRSSGGLSHTAN